MTTARWTFLVLTIPDCWAKSIIVNDYIDHGLPIASEQKRVFALKWMLLWGSGFAGDFNRAGRLWGELAKESEATAPDLVTAVASWIETKGRPSLPPNLVARFAADDAVLGIESIGPRAQRVETPEHARDVEPALVQARAMRSGSIAASVAAAASCSSRRLLVSQARPPSRCIPR